MQFVQNLNIIVVNSYHESMISHTILHISLVLKCIKIIHKCMIWMIDPFDSSSKTKTFYFHIQKPSHGSCLSTSSTYQILSM